MTNKRVFPGRENRYGGPIDRLLCSAHLPDYGPGDEVASVAPAITALSDADILGQRTVSDRSMIACCRSALWLWFNYLDASHQVSQAIDTPTGSFWHGVVHRREPDYGNAKYWFRRVGDHVAYRQVAHAVAAWRSAVGSDENDPEWLTNGDWDPFGMVDWCQQVAREGDPGMAARCREVTCVEWNVMFHYCWDAAGATKV